MELTFKLTLILAILASANGLNALKIENKTKKHIAHIIIYSDPKSSKQITTPKVILLEPNMIVNLNKESADAVVVVNCLHPDQHFGSDLRKNYSVTFKLREAHNTYYALDYHPQGVCLRS